MDYKELIELLRDESNCDVLDYIEDAATAIETLLAERDAAVEDLRVLAACSTCSNSSSHTGEPCRFGADCLGQYWQWRGPQKEAMEHG